MHLHRSAFASSDASAWCPTTFSCARRQRLNVSSWSHSEKLAISTREKKIILACDVATDAVRGQPVVMVASCKARQRQTPFSRSRTFTTQGPCLHVWSGGAWTLIMQQAFSTFGLEERVSAGKEGVKVLRMALLRAGRMVLLRALLAHHFYVHLYLRSARQTSLRLGGWFQFYYLCHSYHEFLHTLAGLEAGINFFSFLYFSIREPFWKARDFYSRAILKSSRSPLACLFFVRSVFDSRTILKSSRFLFARLSLCAAFPIREPFWKARNLYSRAILKSAASCFFSGLPNGTKERKKKGSEWGRAIFRPRRPSVSWIFAPQDFLSHEPTLWFRRH